MASKHTPSTFTLVRQSKSQWLVSSKSKPGVEHVIRRIPGHGLQCSCENALAGKSNCWHLSVVADAEGIVPPSRVEDESFRKPALDLLMGRS